MIGLTPCLNSNKVAKVNHLFEGRQKVVAAWGFNFGPLIYLKCRRILNAEMRLLAVFSFVLVSKVLLLNSPQASSPYPNIGIANKTHSVTRPKYRDSAVTFIKRHD